MLRSGGFPFNSILSSIQSVYEKSLSEIFKAGTVEMAENDFINWKSEY